MPTPNSAVYLEVGSFPLSTAGWEVVDHSSLFDLPDLVGGDVQPPYRRGGLGFRRMERTKTVDLPFIVYGRADGDGVPASDRAEQLWVNRNTVLQALGPLQAGSATGDRTVTFHAPDGGTYAGPGKLVGRIGLQHLTPHALKGMLVLQLTEGGLRASTPVDETSSEATAPGTVDLVVPNPGTSWQDRAVLTLTGTATSVTVTNLTDGPTLAFGGNLTGGVVIDTGAWTAVRGGTVDVVGLVTHSGHPRWMPLRAGETTIRVAPTGGTATLQVVHYPFYA